MAELDIMTPSTELPPQLFLRPNGFETWDYAIFAGLLLASTAIGVYHAFRGDRQRTTAEYLMADRRMSTLPVALSMLVSFVSGILVLGTPAEMYTRGTQLMMRIVGYCFACFLSSWFLVPLFFALRVTSSFEYLERRYHSKAVKLIGTFGMLVGNLFYMGLVVYTPAVALEAATGFPLLASMCATAAVATLYTAMGGLKAVIWTDVFQAGVMVVGMLAILIQGIILVGGPRRVWELNESNGRIIFFDFDPDPTRRLSFWSTVIGGTFSTLTIFGIGQTSVQRYCALPTLKQAQRAVYLNIPFLVVINALAAGIGLVMFAYYADVGCDPLRNKDVGSANQLLPYFVVNAVRVPGLPGAFLAVLFSGALSSMSSSLNSAAAVTWQDVVRYFLTEASEVMKTRVTKALVVFYGSLSLGVAFATRRIGGHVLQASLSFTGATMGPTLGMFLLGALFPFANAKGAIIGCTISAAFSLWLAIGTFILRPHGETLSTSVANCSRNLNFSTVAFAGWDANRTEYDSASMTNGIWHDFESNFTFRSQHNSNFAIHTQQMLPESSGINKMYEVSFLWYSAIGCAITMIVGIVISLVTSSDGDVRPDPVLLIPLLPQILACCPQAIRSRMARVVFCGSYKLDTLTTTPQSSEEETSVTPLKYNLTEEDLSAKETNSSASLKNGGTGHCGVEMGVVWRNS